jgi:hypothetical protein
MSCAAGMSGTSSFSGDEARLSPLNPYVSRPE